MSEADEPARRAERMVALISAAQRPLSAYVRSLVAPWGSPEDVLQEVNLVLWRKADEYDGRGEFLSWACRIAFLQVLAHRKKLRADRLVPMDEAILGDLAGLAERRAADADVRLDALRLCLAELPDESRRLIAARYADGGSVQAAADQASRTAESVRVTLHRIRKALLACVERRLGAIGAPRDRQ